VGGEQNKDVHAGVWGLSGTYGAFTPFFYLPVRIFSQQNQDSPFKLGVLTIVAGHSGIFLPPQPYFMPTSSSY
jgi:hypothetical protein